MQYCLISAFSTDINTLLISRVFQGVATAIINGAMYVIVTIQLPSDKLGYALGIMGSCGYVGLCLSNTVSGMVVYYLSWRAVFLILIPVYLITLFILIKLNKEWYTDDVKEVDNIGSLLYALSEQALLPQTVIQYPSAQTLSALFQMPE